MRLAQINCFHISFGRIYLFLVLLLIELKSLLARVELTPYQIREALVSSEIIPDVILQPPSSVVQITYVKWFIMKQFVNFGTIIKAEKLQSPPASIQWPYEEDAYYSLILTSPDAPSRASPTHREWQHWIVGNIWKNAWQEGQTLTEYRAPGFVSETGTQAKNLYGALDTYHTKDFSIPPQNGALSFVKDLRFNNRNMRKTQEIRWY